MVEQSGYWSVLCESDLEFLSRYIRRDERRKDKNSLPAYE
jgi:hypothetical protein